MKKYFLVIAVVFTGCKNYFHPNSKADSAAVVVSNDADSLRIKFRNFSDSCSYWFDKYECFSYCKSDSTLYAGNKFKIVKDSADKYYALLYPTDNRTDKKEKIHPCGCK